MSNKETIGISLLDVLTNSFAAAVLLMVVISTTVGSGGQKQADDPIESGAQEIATMELTKSKRSKQDPPILFIEAKFPKEGKIKLEYSGTRAESDSISIKRGMYDTHFWSIIRHGNIKREWGILLKSIKKASSRAVNDSIYIAVTIGMAPIEIKIPFSEIEDSHFLFFDEPVESHKDVLVHGKNIKTYVK